MRECEEALFNCRDPQANEKTTVGQVDGGDSCGLKQVRGRAEHPAGPVREALLRGPTQPGHPRPQPVRAQHDPPSAIAGYRPGRPPTSGGGAAPAGDQEGAEEAAEAVPSRQPEKQRKDQEGFSSRLFKE